MDALAAAIELAVGVACAAAGIGVRRRPGIRVAAGLLMVAGVAAIAHASWSLAR